MGSTSSYGNAYYQPHFCTATIKLFVILNPKWTDYNSNLGHAQSVTAGSAGRRLDNVWYGQPVAFDPFKGLLKEITFMFNPSDVET